MHTLSIVNKIILRNEIENDDKVINKENKRKIQRIEMNILFWESKGVFTFLRFKHNFLFVVNRNLINQE